MLNDNGYSNGNGFDTSLLINSIKSIDGNHQWYGKMSSPLPRDKSHPQNYVWHQSHNGYSNGKILGDDNTAKQNIMYSLFIGPLNEGLFTPKTLGFAGESLLSNTYRQKFDECKGHIFQLGVSDNYCNSVKISMIQTVVLRLIHRCSLHLGKSYMVVLLE